jgi:hypothetical protein
MKIAALPLPSSQAQRIVGSFEFWPHWLFYAPVVAQWIALGLRHGDMSLPTAANPAIEMGGLCGESKTAILDLVTGAAREALAGYARLPAPDLAAAEDAMGRLGLAYPVVVKPDIGCNGAGVRLASNRSALAAYFAAYPCDAAVMLQRFVPDPGEAGIFYVRHPGERRGRITSITLKHPPVVVGDGSSTLRALMAADPRARRFAPGVLARLGNAADSVPDPGRVVPLVFVGNHCRGSVFRDGRDSATPALGAWIESLARSLPDFHFGRFDLRYTTLADLRRGRGLTVIEINGVGSEATHVWDPDARLLASWRDTLAHWRTAFTIGAEMRAAGARPAGLGAMYRAWRRQGALMAAYPPSD